MDTDTLNKHGLSKDEYTQILNILGRDPNMTELGIFSAMWNEHCSYKSSKKWLRLLPTKGPQVICGPGENAGIIDIGDGQAIVFKMESHNHPSYIEPFQGAATGVGGILRDIFTMGAKPVALLDCLSFGEPNNKMTKFLLNNVVKGIGHYGNCFGVPNIGGELRFEHSYNQNILVNAFAVGLVRTDRIFYSKATKENLPVVYIGAKTGRDGVGGATMASDEFGSSTENMRPTVQVGAPYLQKCLMEACLELMNTDSIIAIQDMGAAGLTCSSVEMAGKGRLGMEINLDKVPKREKGLSSYELMLSESQERMLMIIDPKRKNLANSIFKKWNLDFEVIGKTLKEDILRFIRHGKIEARIPLSPLSRLSPEYDRPWVTTKKPQRLKKLPVIKVMESLKRLITSENYCSKRDLFSQYDQMVQGNTIIKPGSDAGVIKVGGSKKCLAVTADVTPRYCKVNPLEGAKQAVAECFRNIISCGGLPLGLTDNLNFGNPEKPEIMGQIVQAIKGISQASLKLKMPVVSGNVSLYNETNGNAISPTPSIGAVGIIDHIDNIISMKCENSDKLFLVGEDSIHLERSALLVDIMSIEQGDCPKVSLSAEYDTGMFILKANKEKLIQSAHDISDGGLILAIFEMCIHSDKGVKIKKSDPSWYFSESQGRYIISINDANINAFKNLALQEKIPIKQIGIIGGTKFSVGSESSDLDSLKDLYFQGLKKLLY